MKFLIVLSLFATMFFLDCPSKKKNTKAQKTKAEKNMSEFLSYENKTDGIEYKFKAEIKKAGKYNGIEYKNDFVQIEYELNNTSGKDFLVFNQGHFGTITGKVYVEPSKDGTVEISQKAFEEPKDRNCPDRFVAIIPNASWLKSNQKVTKKIEIELPLQTRTPYDDCKPKPELPKDFSKVKFCIGVTESDSEKVKLTDDGRIQGEVPIKKQKLLCSDLVELK